MGSVNTLSWMVDKSLMVANEVVDDLISSNKDGILCKLDLEKAYDHVCWDFVDYMLGRLFW